MDRLIMLAEQIERLDDDDPSESAIAKAFHGLATVLVKGGFRSKLCERRLRSAMAIAAKEALEMEGAEPTNQNIAIRTGIDRRYVQDSLDQDNQDLYLCPLGLVLNRWQNDPAYSTNHIANSIRLSGTSPSFESLCRNYASNLRWTSVLATLQAAECVQSDGECVQLIRNTPYRGDEAALLQMALSSFTLLGSTLGRNVTEPDESKRYFQRYYLSRDLVENHEDEFREMCFEALTTAYETLKKRIDDFEATHDMCESSKNKKVGGIMLTYYQD